MNTKLAADEIVIDETKAKPKEKIVIPNVEDITMPKRNEKTTCTSILGKKCFT